MSVVGPFETCQQSLGMSAYRGRKEVERRALRTR
jgi:hypothetical protein